MFVKRTNWASLVKISLSSFDLERHADDVVVGGGGSGKRGLENNLMVLIHQRIYLPPIPWPCAFYCFDESDCYACLLIPAPM